MAMLEFGEAEAIFASIIQQDPHRIDYMDHYSNVLYVMDEKTKLAFLAQLATSVDKYRPETCCVIGNYYSLKSEHEKAVMYFRRALSLDRSFLQAWTLMGHEYVELKNTHAAIESYRRAVDVNRKDYRAWYGLGLAYEILEMHSYALYYYQRATSLKPYDTKMWQAVGACLGRIGRCDAAIRAYKRALISGDGWSGGVQSLIHATNRVGRRNTMNAESFSGPVMSEFGRSHGLLDPEVLYQIALQYEKMDHRSESAVYMELVIAREYDTGDQAGNGGNADSNPDDEPESSGIGVTETTSKARLWLVRYEYGQGNLQRALQLAEELTQDNVETEEVKALIRDIRTRMEPQKSQAMKS